MDGSHITVTFGLVAITWATISPTWLFIRVKPHLLDGVLSDLNGLGATVVIARAPSGRPGVDRSRCRRSGSWPRPGRPRSAAAWPPAATTAAAGCAPPAGRAAPTPTATAP